MISIVTSTIGRELYLSRLIDSMEKLSGHEKIDFEWCIYFQVEEPSETILSKIENSPIGSRIFQQKLPKLVTTSVILEDFRTKNKYPLLLKLDDDALICSPDFLLRYAQASKLMPNTILHACEIGGYTTIAPMDTRKVIYDSVNNVYYSVAPATRSTALSVLLPPSFLEKVRFPHAQFDAEFISTYCLTTKYPRYQFQNSIIVEHQEGIEGQYYRVQTDKK